MPASDDNVLMYIYNNADVSQRQLVEKTDLSLGSINLILHRLVSRGLLKIENVSARHLRYILTPQGIARCTKKTIAFVKQAYHQIMHLQTVFLSIQEKCTENNRTILLYGDQDELFRILIQTVNDKGLDQVFYVTDLKTTEQEAIVLVWQEDFEEASKAQGRQTINIVRELDPTALI
ncbi:MAG: hypothetical protein GX173_07710 [Ruminococcaceae bacterium]|nr:hypothetical protein [Oscillospiraceae bacterium]